jgi:hypothetical protein
VQHEPPGTPALRTQKSFDRERRIERASREQPRQAFEGHGIDLGPHLALAARFAGLRFMQHAERDHVDAGRRLAQSVALDETSGKPYAVLGSAGSRVQLTSAAAVSLGAAPGSAGCASPPRSISDLAFSSFIIGEGVVTARVIFTIR